MKGRAKAESMPSVDLDRLLSGWRAPLIAAFVALIAGLPGLIAMPPQDRDESRFAQATAQMLESGDLVRIQFQDEPRNKKPVGIHWLQAASVALTSSEPAREIWAYRIPSLLGAMLAAAACAWGAAGFLGPRGGVLAGATLATTLMLNYESLTAKTDAVLCGCVTLAMAALSRLYADGVAGVPLRRRHKAIFWCALAASILIKGPIGPMVAGLTLVALGLADKKWRWMRRLGWVWGLLIILAVTGPWAMAITVATNGQFWGQALGGDMASKLTGARESHGAPPGLYLLMSPVLLHSAIILAPAAAVLAWRRRAEPALRFALAWLIPSWIVFELTPTKLPHYVLPTFGAVAWLAAAAAVATPMGRISRWSGAALAGLAAMLISAAAIMGLHLYGGADAVVWTALTVGFAVAGFVVAAGFLLRDAPARALLAACAGALLCHAVLFGALGPQLNPLWISRAAARSLIQAGVDPRNGVTPGPVAVTGYAEPSLIFLLGTETEIVDEEDAAAAVAQGRPVFVAKTSEPRFRLELARQKVVALPIAAVKGLNYSKGKPVTLTLYRNRTGPR